MLYATPNHLAEYQLPEIITRNCSHLPDQASQPSLIRLMTTVAPPEAARQSVASSPDLRGNP
jgi:hypothetical protein